MVLPFDKLTQNYTRPKVYLCETNKERICALETTELSAVFKFNAYDELTCTIPRTYTDMITGETKVNPFYDKIEALRLIYLENFGYFEIQDPEIQGNGIKETKTITAYGYEYTLSQKYLEEFYVNTGEVNDIGVNSDGTFNVITLYNPLNPSTSLLHLALEKDYCWSIGHVDPALQTMSRTFEISRASIYDFIVQDICDKFNCFAVFDTINNTINLYAEALITKHIGDGERKTFTTSPIYTDIDTVSINGYKTTAYVYNNTTGELTFDVAPANGAKIEITDGSQKQWTTDVYVSFDNLAQEVNVSYSAEDIKTVLTVKGTDDLDIREVNMGLPYIVDLSYYYSVDWMGQELFDVYTNYLQKYDQGQDKYKENSIKRIELEGRIDYVMNRLSLEYSIADHVNSTTVGKYYVRGGTPSNYYYTEVSLPSEYNANTTYYTLSGNDIDETKFEKFYDALYTYYKSSANKDVSELQELSKDFAFMELYTIEYLINELSNTDDLENKDNAVNNFLSELWNQLGYNPIKDQYYSPYKDIQQKLALESGYNDPSNENYWRYHISTLVVSSASTAMEMRQDEAERYQKQSNQLKEENALIQKNATMDVFFLNYFKAQGLNEASAKSKATQLLIRLSAFLREDEYTDDNFAITDSDDTDAIMQMKQELLECGRIELAKLCEPKLAFSMDMANIYALPEFEPIIHQFQLGNLINVAIRPDYIKKARLLEVYINFHDFSDFSCEFGELTNLRTPSSIHADLLSAALSAGKSVASNASYWNKGADLATSTDVKIQQGLISATGGLYNSDQSVVIDDNGILLRKVNEDGSFSPYQAWITSNTILLSSDGFKSGSQPRMGLGEFEIDGKKIYSFLSEYMLSGYIEGSTMVGGTINIGNGAFVVDRNGNVTMAATNQIDGYATTDTTDALKSDINTVESKITLTDDKITAEVKRATEAENDLSSKITINANAISSKVDSGDFGTLIEQNYDHVKIAWNNNSKYIAFEDGALNIYYTSEHSKDTLLMQQTYNGVLYYHGGDTVGKIGTVAWETDNTYRGIAFNLETDGDYMCWAHRDDAGDDSYTVKLIYHANDQLYPAGLYLECTTYAQGNLYLTQNDRFKIWSGGGCGYDGKMTWCNKDNTNYVEIDGPNKRFNVYSGCNFSVNAICDWNLQSGSNFYMFKAASSGDSTFTIGNNVQIDIWNNINMHGWNLVDTSITQSSDARLKTNIQDTDANALSIINQIEMKQFDWIESGQHEELGMIAQQLQMIAPDFVYTDETSGKLSIKINRFIPYLIKSIQELTEYITDGASTFANRSWRDTYTMEEKQQFILDNGYSELDSTNSVPHVETEMIAQPIRLPVEQKGEDNNE